MLEVRGVTKRFGGLQVAVTLLGSRCVAPGFLNALFVLFDHIEALFVDLLDRLVHLDLGFVGFPLCAAAARDQEQN